MPDTATLVPNPPVRTIRRVRILAVSPRSRMLVAYVGWFLAGFVARGLLATHIEGVLDHDQAVVGLMAFDISQARRWPIFFDGQRYMGALEAYVAAPFVRVLGFSPQTVTLAPLLFCGLFVMGQYALWRHWKGPAVGHLAAIFTVCCSPMASLWTMIPRGGYVEILCWALPVLACYGHFTNPGSNESGRFAQFLWGLLLGLGYFLNPLSIVVYTTLFFDWVVGRHGLELRRARELDGSATGRLLDCPYRLLVWAGVLTVFYLIVTFGCHVELNEGADFVFVERLVSKPYSTILGLGVVAMLLGGFCWWTGCGARAVRLLASHRTFAAGLACALIPFVLFHSRSRLGLEPAHASLPMWLRDPCSIGPNVSNLARALGPLFACDVAGVTIMYDRWPETWPAPRWPQVAAMFSALSVLMLAMIGLLIGRVVARDRARWSQWLALRSDQPASPTMLMTLGLIVSLALYLVQATSPDGSSTRYLVPVWIFLPGLLASALVSLKKLRILASGLMAGLWLAAQTVLWQDLDRQHRCRPLTEALTRLNVPVIIAPQHVGLIVTELSAGRIGLWEYQPFWTRVHDRYRDRFASGGATWCVAEVPNRGLQQEDLSQRMRVLASSQGDKVRLVKTISGFEIWQADLPPSAICNQSSSVHATY